MALSDLSFNLDEVPRWGVTKYSLPSANCSRAVLLYLFWAIYKTRNKGTGNGMRGMRGTQYSFNIPENVPEDSGKCSRRFRGMFKKIPENVREDSGKCSRRFRRMLKKISRNLNLDLFFEILLIFYQILQLNCEKAKEYSLCC